MPIILQVRLSVSRRGIKLHMPPPYSIVVQVIPLINFKSLGFLNI